MPDANRDSHHQRLEGTGEARALHDALEQQNAIGEILRVMSASPTDVRPVLQAVALHAARLCDAPFARVMVSDGTLLHPVADYSAEPVFGGNPVPLARTSITGRAVLDRATVHLPDIATVLATEFPDARENIERLGSRAVLAVPLLREGRADGAIFLFRREPGWFPADQVALVQTFAQQAAIAIENVRLFHETKEALERQTAMSEILRVISRSPTDVQPVFDTIASAALGLCDSVSALVFTYDGTLIHLAAIANLNPEDEQAWRQAFPRPPSRDTATARAILTGRVAMIPDVLADPDYTIGETAVKTGFRSALGVPLIRDGKPIGAIGVGRSAPGSFRDSEISLLRTFADQAVIAIQNVRLFNETQEGLAQQTAIAGVLKVISQSAFDLRRVLKTLIETATRLCEASHGFVFRPDGDIYRLAAAHGASPEFEAHIARIAVQPERGYLIGRVVRERQPVQIPDAAEDPDYRHAESQRLGGYRTMLGVPMLNGNEVVGVIVVWRTEVRAFSGKQIDLLATFADQAAIAIENARLFNETNEALERQTATAEVLKVISGSPTDLQPVFDSIAERAAVLSSAKYVYVTTFDGELIHMRAAYGPGAEAHRNHYPMKPSMGTVAGRVVVTRASVEIEDMLADPDYEQKESAARIGFRCALGVPMLREGHIVGCIVATRAEAGSFAAKVIDLLKTFADQAVIAIENVRLFNETKEALEQQTAVAQILRVISSSPTDVLPVLEAIAERAARLCDAAAASMYMIEGGALRHLASRGSSADPVTHVETLPINGETITGCAVLEHRTIQVTDLLGSDGHAYPLSREIAKRHHHRTVVVTPLLREGQPFGAMLLRRNEVRAFSDREIALLRTFGDQAAIALENVRLFNETKEALDQQRASAEVLAAISNSIADTSPVFERILESCERLFAGRVIAIERVTDANHIVIAAYLGPQPEHDQTNVGPLRRGASISANAIITRTVQHYPDVASDADAPARSRAAYAEIGARAVIVAPMVWEAQALGAISVGREHPGPFSEKEIGLLKTFADQAVIAIQNARLFHEIEEKSRQLEVANKHKSEFLANMSHELRTPLNAVIGFSEVLLEHLFGDLNDKQDDYLKDIHSSGKHLLSLINDILDLSKIEAGRMELEPSSVDVAAAISNALTLIRERAQHHAITLAQDVDDALGTIVADERKFRQILVNLLSNAVKFTPDGGRIDVVARRFDGVAEIAVRDTGIGIAPEDHAAVFEEFRQVGRDYTKKQEGTGLGLALTRRFVELHGGRIRVDSTPGHGATFTFTIPLTH